MSPIKWNSVLAYSLSPHGQRLSENFVHAKRNQLTCSNASAATVRCFAFFARSPSLAQHMPACQRHFSVLFS